MRRPEVLVALALLAGGCGGDGDRRDAAPARTQTADAGSAKDKACAEARRLIADLPVGEDTDGDADYADRAADALEKVGSPAVKILRDAELAVIEVRTRDFNRAIRRLRRAGGECGEREAARVLVPAAFAYELDEAIRDHNRKSKTAPSDLVQGLAFDARRFARLTARVKALTVPDVLRDEHRRFLALLEESVRFYRRAAANPGAYDAPASDRLDARRDRASRQLTRKMNALNDRLARR